jgi:hypothetical protein
MMCSLPHQAVEDDDWNAWRGHCGLVRKEMNVSIESLTNGLAVSLTTI